MARRKPRRARGTLPALAPREADLVVAPDGKRWSVGPFGSRAQVSFATFEAAVAHARAFTSARSLDVWLTRDGVAYTRDGGHGGGGPTGG